MAGLVKLEIGKTRTIDRGERFILAQLAAIGDGASVTAGIHSKDFNKVQTFRGKRVGKTPVGVYAAFNEFGTRHIPPRPFMRLTLDKNKNLHLRQTAAGMRSIYNSQLSTQALLLRQASRTQKWMRRSVRTWGVPGNSPSTRKTNTRSRTGPLMDTRTMVKSVTSETQRGSGGLIPDFKRFLQLADRIAMRRGIFGGF